MMISTSKQKIVEILNEFLLINFIFNSNLGKLKQSKPQQGMKLNMLTQNGYMYNRVRDIADRIFWKCALNATHGCNAVFATNKFLRVLDNQRNNHNHSKNAFDEFKKKIQVSKKR